MGKFLPLLLASLRRKPLRAFFTLASILIAFLLFGLAESMRHALSSGVDIAGADRLITMHKVSFTQLLPASYQGRIRGIDGVLEVTPQTWLGTWFRDERSQIPGFPVEPEPFLSMYPEYLVPAEQRAAWIADRRGALIGRGLADLYGWKVGDLVPLQSSIWARKDGSFTWEVTIRGIYDLPEGGDTRQILIHHEYFDESRERGQGLVGWYLIRIERPELADPVGARIDALFENSPAETKTSSERAMAQSFLNQVGNLGAILNAIVIAVFFTMLLVTANTMAQSVRERTSEIGVLKTLGYSNRGVLGLVISEALLITVLGGLLGLAGAWWIGVQFEPVFRQYLPGFSLPAETLPRALLVMLALGLAAGAVPATQAMRLRIVEALRKE
jgi:putative ABC transport system permease protein